MKNFIISCVIWACFAANSFSAVLDSVYYNFYTRHADNEYCTHGSPVVSFTVFLNRDKSLMLTDNAPRWYLYGDANITGSGRMGVELGYFEGHINIGDSVSFNVICTETQQAGTLKREITNIPFIEPPRTLVLAPAALPGRPEDVKVRIDSANSLARVIKWTYVEGVTYSIYRRDLSVKLLNGLTSYLYHLVTSDAASGEFTDTDVEAGKTYAYIIIAKNGAGVMGPRSLEISDDVAELPGLTAEAKSSTVHLSWNSLTNAPKTVRGYNIYRKEEGSSFNLIAYSGNDTTFVDSRLTPSAKYYYKVKARYDYNNEIAESDNVEVTTSPASDKLYSYLTLRVAVVIYKNTNRGKILDSEIPGMKKMLELARLFYWRNSNMKLNVVLDYHVISDYKTFEDPSAHSDNLNKTVADLAERGVINTQYDVVFRITTATDGYFSYGAPSLGLPGPARATGFSWVQWPVGTGVVYPGKDADITYGLTWVFTHEVQHAIDAILDTYVNAEGDVMYHGDTPWLFPAACGEQFDFQSKLFRNYHSYEQIRNDWGEIYQSVDNDKDGFPDNDPLVPLDEERFGSSSESGDTDGDKLSDKAEAVAGAFEGTSPVNEDTDGDGVKDGSDLYPRYASLTSIPKFKPVIDGTIDEGWTLFTNQVIFSKIDGFAPKLYLGYDSDSLYVGLSTPLFCQPEFNFDFDGDGFWHGIGNTFVKLDLTNLKISSSDSRLTSAEVRAIADAGLWDYENKYIQAFGDKKVFPMSAMHGKGTKNGNTYQFEFSIPRNEAAGLTLVEGDSVGLNLYFNSLSSYSYATLYDQYEFVYFKLGTSIGIEDAKDNAPSDYSLAQNYPNPFNPVTRIKYSIPESGYVSLKVYDSLGRIVKVLYEGERSAGYYETAFNASDLSSGIYFYELAAKNFKTAKKMCVIK